MLPVLIFQHSPTEGPGYFTTFLDAQRIPWRRVRIDAGEAVPDSLNGYSGVCLMGGAMSVNDPLPWIAPLLDLIQIAVQRQIPVIGHCLGGQLLSRALGGTVSANPQKEIGWAEVEVVNPAAATPWFGALQREPAFHWHGETFSLPDSAVLLLRSAHCAHQAYVVDNRHLGMQCHIEMTPELIRAWCENGADELAATDSPAVQTPAAMLHEVDEKTRRLHAWADKIYSRWIQGLAV